MSPTFLKSLNCNLKAPAHLCSDKPEDYAPIRVRDVTEDYVCRIMQNLADRIIVELD